MDDEREALANGASPLTVDLARALLLAQQGDYAKAEIEAAAIAASDTGNGHYLYAAGQVGSRLVKIVGKDRSLPAAKSSELREKFGKLAVDWIQNAQTLKFLSAPSTRWLLADDRELDSLRARADFQALVALATERTKARNETRVAFARRRQAPVADRKATFWIAPSLAPAFCRCGDRRPEATNPETAKFLHWPIGFASSATQANGENAATDSLSPAAFTRHVSEPAHNLV